MTKAEWREQIWSLLQRRRVARFPFPIHDRIPNFVGAADAAAHLATLAEWKAAHRLKVNPDAPQAPVRLRALEDGKVVFMAVPRLRSARCFIRLDPAKLGGQIRSAASIGGAARLGEPVAPAALGRIDLVVAGSVAVDRHGGRVGKGGGYSDLEFGLGRELGIVADDTPVVTTVHPLQVVRGRIPMAAHDVPLDVVATPQGVVRLRRSRSRPPGILWDRLTETQIRAMPVLEGLRKRLRAEAGRA
jgi:5-formyltetrahydrofolate cyclo-ligase